MSARRRRTTNTARVATVVALAAVLVAAAFAGGCWFNKQANDEGPGTTGAENPVPTSTPEASATVQPAEQLPIVDDKTGALHVPQPGSAERQALADAARVFLDTDSRFVVNQMYSNNAWALAQLTPKQGGNSVFVAYRHGDGAWTAYWKAPAAGGTATELRAADARISDEVVGAFSFKGVKEPAAEPAADRPSNAQAIAAASTVVKKASPDVEITGAEVLGMDKDSKGRWWAWVLVKGPSNVDPLTVYEYRESDGSWKLWDFGTEPRPVPADVDF